MKAGHRLSCISSLQIPFNVKGCHRKMSLFHCASVAGGAVGVAAGVCTENLNSHIGYGVLQGLA